MFCGGEALAQTYQANLGPMPLDAATNKNLLGRGEATATLEGKTLTVSGRLLIRTPGQVSAAVRYGEIEIERGGRLSGHVDATDAPKSRA